MLQEVFVTFITYHFMFDVRTVLGRGSLHAWLKLIKGSIVNSLPCSLLLHVCWGGAARRCRYWAILTVIRTKLPDVRSTCDARRPAEWSIETTQTTGNVDGRVTRAGGQHSWASRNYRSSRSFNECTRIITFWGPSVHWKYQCRHR